MSPSAIKRDKMADPREMSQLEILKSSIILKILQFLQKIGFDCLEIHMAHGYLLHQFFSPISNKRSDDYGGNLKNRSRLLIEVFKIVRKVWPKNRLLGARITGSDNLKNGSNINDAVFLSKELKN